MSSGISFSGCKTHECLHLFTWMIFLKQRKAEWLRTNFVSWVNSIMQGELSKMNSHGSKIREIELSTWNSLKNFN